MMHNLQQMQHSDLILFGTEPTVSSKFSSMYSPMLSPGNSAFASFFVFIRECPVPNRAKLVQLAICTPFWERTPVNYHSSDPFVDEETFLCPSLFSS